MAHKEKPNAENSQPDANDPDADKRSRMRHDWSNLIEDLIEDGRQRGLFDNLTGKGQPLNLNRNHYEGSQALSNQLLKDNDLRPAWISQRIEIQERTDQLRDDIGREWRRFHQAFVQAAGDTHRTALALGWDEQCLRWESRVAQINKLVDAYNLRRPNSSLEIFKLRLADELVRANAQRRLQWTSPLSDK